MYREQGAPHTYDSRHAFGREQWQPPAGGRHRAHADAFGQPPDKSTGPGTAGDFTEPLVPPGTDWDPAEELAFMLRDAPEQYAGTIPDDGAPGRLWEPGAGQADPQESAAEPPGLGRRRRPGRRARRRQALGAVRTASVVLAVLAAVIASAVGLLGGMAAYDPLRLSATSPASHGVVSWWPLLVYGPWLVASLSVLRAALHRRRAVHSWIVVLLFSAIAMFLCVWQAPRTLSDSAAAALPGLASMISFQQVVRQITLNRPPRRTVSRHGQARAGSPGPTEGAGAGPDKGGSGRQPSAARPPTPRGQSPRGAMPRGGAPR
ncbi:DUF1109 domain-containing protein [Streptomyces tendae]|uniref:DUF1109 domain-containing protein n=1 Tax=Streptomyces tendae TaxID=1932 RepID=UPI0037917E84